MVIETSEKTIVMKSQKWSLGFLPGIMIRHRIYSYMLRNALFPYKGVEYKEDRIKNRVSLSLSLFF